MSSSADQFNWKEMRKFWETHSALFSLVYDSSERGAWTWRRRRRATPEACLHAFADPNRSAAASPLRRAARTVDRGIQRIAVAFETVAGTLLIPLNVPISCGRCGFLFRAA